MIDYFLEPPCERPCVICCPDCGIDWDLCDLEIHGCTDCGWRYKIPEGEFYEDEEGIWQPI